MPNFDHLSLLVQFSGGGTFVFLMFFPGHFDHFLGSTHYVRSTGPTDPSNENTFLRLHVSNLFLFKSL